MSAALFPLFADLRERAVCVVGGGMVAQRKVEALLHAGARVSVGAPELSETLRDWAAAGRIAWRQGAFVPQWLDDAWLVIAATDDHVVNRAVAQAATERRLLANVVDDAELSSFQVPAVVERGALQVAISSGGHAPMVARHLRRWLEGLLDDSWAGLVDLLGRERARIRARLPDTAARRAWFEGLLDGALPRLLRQRQPLAAQAEFERSLAGEHPAPAGRVALVGAGAGDAGTLTLAALRALNTADVILHDRLVSPEVLALARRDAQRIAVGKSAGHHATPQERIHALMLEHARAGRRVVRLKGGDPFVFGRGGEELEFLRAHGVPYEVVPGITAALACAAQAGIPLTHRDHAQSLRLVTAHCAGSLDTLDWTALAQERQTLAVYMGVAALQTFRDQLLAAGRAPTTPFALIENGGRASQRVVAGTLAQLPDSARAFAVQSPALLVVGEVAALADTLHWHGAPPLRLPPASPGTATADTLPRAA